MTRMSNLLIATSGFTQVLASGTTFAQNTFYDDLCQVSQIDEASCDDVGCSAIGGRCTPTQGQSADGRDIQGCICIGPTHPEKECQVVHDHTTGQAFCVDLLCPPLETYSCDATCTCPGPNEYGDPLCQPDPTQGDPTLCFDLGCSAQGGICIRTSAQLPDGQFHQVCHCERPPQSGPIGGCEVVFNHETGQPVCADFDCGEPDLYECSPTVADCRCLCDNTIPPEVTGLRWSNKVQYFWNRVPCATVYNAYRQAPALTNCGGVACSYGPCLWSGLVAHNATDATVPLLGRVQFYLVTAESYVAEGTMGSSSVAPRPNTSPCGTPPPSP